MQLPLYPLIRFYFRSTGTRNLKVAGYSHTHTQGVVTPSDSIVTAATAGQNLEWLSLVVLLLTMLIFGH